MAGVADMYENGPLAAKLLPLLRRAAESRKITVSFYANVASLHKVELLKLSDSRWFRIEIGVQSMNPAALGLCNRGATVRVIAKHIDLMAQYAPKAHKILGLIRGLPKDTTAGYLTTLEWALSTGMQLSVNQLRLVQGTEFNIEPEKFGLTVGADYPYFVLSTSSMSANDMHRLRAITDRVMFMVKLISPHPALQKHFQALAAGFARSKKFPRVTLALAFASLVGRMEGRLAQAWLYCPV